MNHKDIIHTIKQEKDFLKRKYNISEIGLFGSFAREEHTINSDIDLLVEFSTNPDLFTYIEIINYLKKKLRRKVDLVTEEALRPEIKNQIMSEVVYL
ncbi:MAG TPA: nucleotidyltransferase family protein [Candidatus Kapabacteria bacterium]|nr:nucleotidyltransferase family protein [Candidatus Kapabacteria bacterium]HPO62140.1 nucleotidyltransferase family protein [Candidatus Kapabacteria bacterium]